MAGTRNPGGFFLSACFLMYSRSQFVALLALAPLAVFAAPSGVITVQPAVIPAPANLEVTGPAGFSLAGGLAVSTATAGLFPEAVKAAMSGFGIVGVSATDAGTASGEGLVFKKVAGLPPEGYRIAVTTRGAVVEATEAAGAFYAVQTLIQSVVKDAAGKPALPAMSVADSPRFGWRGLMLDSARHFVRPPDVKRMIDLMALHKMNRLHWHLTDDQGWRIEIKKYPKLTQVGATRSASPVIGNRGKSDGESYGPYFYTQEEVRDIVAYAKARSITVIPEIEMPGHAAAALASYPEFGNTDVKGYNPKVRTSWGIERHVYAPKEETFKFLDDVIGEVAALFPDSPYIHVGGDECPKDQWNASPFAQKLMTEHKLFDKKGKPDAHRLQSWFLSRAEKMVNARGKRLIGWDEIQEGGLSPTATMMVWRSWNWAVQAVKQGNDVVMSPGSHCYLDHGQGKTPGKEFEPIAGTLTMETVHSMEPIPKGLTPEQAKHILGVQGNLWSEYMFNQAKLEYQAFPRALAIAEVGWCAPEKKDFKAFSARLAVHQGILDTLKVNYRKADGSPAQPDKKIERDHTPMPKPFDPSQL